MHFVFVFAEAISIGVVSYGIGLIPLVVQSQSRLSALTVLGNGQLLGAAWSLIFFKMAMGAASTLRPQQFGLSRTVVALSDMGGVLFMWMANRKISSRALNANRHPDSKSEADPEQLSPLVLSCQRERDDTELGEQKQDPNAVAQPAVLSSSASTSSSHTTPAIGPHQQRIYLFTFSLLIQVVIHGINNGHRATEIHRPLQSTGKAMPASSLDHISHYVDSLFENALMALAFSTTLRSASFPIARCKQHLIVTSAAVPLAEMFSYTVITVIGISAAQYEVFPLFALRSFTDGMFIYAVFVLRYSLGGSETKCGGRICTSLLSLAGTCMSTVGAKLVLIPIFAFWKLMEKYC